MDLLEYSFDNRLLFTTNFQKREVCLCFPLTNDTMHRFNWVHVELLKHKSLLPSDFKAAQIQPTCNLAVENKGPTLTYSKQSWWDWRNKLRQIEKPFKQVCTISIITYSSSVGSRQMVLRLLTLLQYLVQEVFLILDNRLFHNTRPRYAPRACLFQCNFLIFKLTSSPFINQ